MLGNYLAVTVDTFAPPSFLPSLHPPCFLAVSLSAIFTLLIMVISSYRVVILDSTNRIISLTIYIKIVCSVQSLSHVRLFVTSWITARQASLSITNCRNSLKLMSIESVMPSNLPILCCPLLLPPSIFPSIRVFSDESVLHIRWPEHWSFSFSISPSNEYSGLISFRMDWLVRCARKLTKHDRESPIVEGVYGVWSAAIR